MRHLPGLRALEPLWRAGRPTYRWLIARLGQQGVPVRVGGETIALDPSVVHENWEHAELRSYRCFSDLVSAGDVVFDIGAHYGTYSIIAARRTGPEGLVIAFEPADDTRTLLQRHLAWNVPANRVRVMADACGAAVGQAVLWSSMTADGGASIVTRSGARQLPVRMTTVDKAAALVGRPPTIIKIDVEGAEFDVLRGAAHTLATARPMIIVSTHPAMLLQHGTSEGELLAWLKDQKYDVSLIDEDQERHFVACPAEASAKADPA